MPPLSETPWHPLPLTTPIRGAPPLLLQSTFTSSTYTILLTDLVHIWSTTASKRAILALADTFQSSIDPTETSQLTILLTKLESALSLASAHTDVTLTSTYTGDLQIHTSTELPPPLKELKWVFILTRLPDAEFTNLFLLPVLSVVSTLADQVESLVRVVKDKDKIIERLTDQVAEQGLDVKNLLGGGRARRRGLERFEVEAWREDYIQEGEKRVGEVVKEVFGEGARCGEAPGVRGLGMVEGWWTTIEEDGNKPKVEKRESSERPRRADDGIRSLTRDISPRRIASPKRERTSGDLSPPKRMKFGDSDDEDNDFAVQKTPPPKSYHAFTLKKPSPPPKPVAPEPGDTASDSDTLDLPPPRKFAKKPSPPPIPRRSVDEPRRYTPVAAATAADEETEDSDTVVVPSVSKTKQKMVIGGKKKPVVVPDDTEDEEVEQPKEVKKVVGKIGRIGKPKIESDRGGPSTVAKPPTPPPPPPAPREPTPEENEDEKADRKRRELEKELEAKKKAPAKKKRKF
ncbi:XRCC4-like factor-domain-containing protein [Morchella snyderi]|nr:XRCC4-like factor-domain-containing protein [Morchella snyderi]